MGIIIKPIISEKMTAITESNSQRYAFVVSPMANKIEICSAVEKMYNVKVGSVNTCRYNGKCSIRYTKAGVISGRKPAFKKAVITLQGEGTIDFFSNI